MSNKEFFFPEKLSYFFFKLLLKYVNLMLAQTDVAKSVFIDFIS